MDYSAKFQWLLDTISEPFVILDDDLRFSARSGDRLVAATDDDIVAGFEQMEALLATTPLVGFHPRAMGHTTTESVLFNKRINAIQGINPNLVTPMKVDYWPILADMVLNLKLLTRGQSNALICTLFWDQCGGSNAPGGCSLHRTWEQQRDAVLGLKSMFPEVVTVKEKVVKKGWWGDKPRYDFVISWRRAVELGEQHAAL